MHFSLNNDFPRAQVADAAEQVHRRVSQYAVTTLLLETIADLLSPLTRILEKAGFLIYRVFRPTRNPVKQALTGIQPPATFFLHPLVGLADDLEGVLDMSPEPGFDRSIPLYDDLQ